MLPSHEQTYLDGRAPDRTISVEGGMICVVLPAYPLPPGFTVPAADLMLRLSPGYLPWLDAEWSEGRRNGAELWRRLRSQGFRGSLRVVTEWATRRRRADQINADTLSRIPSARTISRLMTSSRDTLTKAETVTAAAVEAGVPALVEAREIVAAFHLMIRLKTKGDLSNWVERGRDSLVASFANGVDRDIQITKLKLVKRQMYGRGKLDLLQARLIGSTP